ncbi:unnamed protein product [Blepharisma stoltei]|uniref:Exocyst complex component Sec6 n=1 Tax=Blepharisma stoltei TaxID=1481888 RepID=A0AAU9ISV4_9CILI|nr:unnamed protein product [Blepharisma stoltei]
MNFSDENQALAKAKTTLNKTLSELEGDISLVHVRIKKLIADFTKNQENSAFELGGALNREVDTHRQVLCTLHKAASNALLEPIEHLGSLCPEQPGSLKSIVIAQANISQTINIVKPFLNLEKTLADLRKDFGDKEKLASIVNQGIKLSDHKRKLLEKAPPSVREVLKKQFAPLDEFEAELNTSIWRVIENSIEIAQKQPKAIVRVIKIIRNIQDQAEEKVREHLGLGIEKRLLTLLNVENLEKLSENTHQAINELGIMIEKVLPCFPPEYNLYNYCVNKYRNCIQAAIEPQLSDLEKLRASPGLLVLIFQWVSEYSEAIKKYCADSLEDVDIQILFAKVKELMPDFIQHMENLLSEWINRALQAHSSNNQIMEMAAKYEPLTDTLPEEMFSAVNQQLNFVSNRLSGEVLIEIFRVCATRLISQQKKLSSQLSEMINLEDPELQVASLCLSINNNQRASKHTVDLMKSCKKYYTESFQLERIERMFEGVQKGFLTLCGEGANALAISVLRSIAPDTVLVLFTTNWIASGPVPSAFATMEDYDKDISQWLSTEYYERRFKRRFFEVYLQAYLERLVQSFSKVVNVVYDYQVLLVIQGNNQASKNKKEMSLVLSQFRESVYRDKHDFLDFASKLEMQIPIETLFNGLVALQEQGDLDVEQLSALIQPFIPNSEQLAKAIITVIQPQT